MLSHSLTNHRKRAGNIIPDFQKPRLQEVKELMECTQLSMVDLDSNSEPIAKVVLIFDVPCFYPENNSI